MNNLSQTLEKEKKLCLYSLAVTFLWGLLAHGYGIMDSNFSHDSLNEFNGLIFGNQWKIQLGRFLIPVYRNFSRTDLTLPWLIGILGLLWCGLAVYLVIRIFQIENPFLIFMTAGIFTANLTISSTIATFIHDFDCYMLSLMLSVAAVFCWKKHSWGWVAGALPLFLSLALYQSFIAVTIALVMIVCMLDLLEEVPFRDVFLHGLKAITMLLLAGVMYYVGMKAVQKVTGITMITGKYNTVDRALDLFSLTAQDLIYLIRQTYLFGYEKFVNAVSPYPALSSMASKLVLLFICICVLLGLLKRNVKLPAKLLCLVLLVLLPFAMNIMHFMTFEQAHELMRFGLWLTYLFALLLGRWLAGYLKAVKIPSLSGILGKAANVPAILCAFLVTIVVYGNVQTANAMYLKKDLEHDAYMAVMNRVVYRMESYEGYEPGVTPIALVGLPAQMADIVPGFETYRDPNGMWMSDALCFADRDRWRRYFDTVLMNSALFAPADIWYGMANHPQVVDMPIYPASGSLAMVDGVLVMKLS